MRFYDILLSNVSFFLRKEKIKCYLYKNFYKGKDMEYTIHIEFWMFNDSGCGTYTNLH